MEPTEQHRVHVYLINQYNEVLLRKLHVEENRLTTKDITIESLTIPLAVTEVEKQWGILCSDEEFSHLYTFTDQNVTYHGYVIVMRLGTELITFIASHLDWMFYDFKNIHDHILPKLIDSTEKLVERLIAEV